MRISIYITAICIMALSSFLVYAKLEHPGDRLSLTVEENDDTYRMEAYYNPANTNKVQNFINSKIAPNGLFKSDSDYLDISTALADRTEFFVKSAPGKMIIELDKKKNTYASYLRIKKMCSGIKDLLAGK